MFNVASAECHQCLPPLPPTSPSHTARGAVSCVAAVCLLQPADAPQFVRARRLCSVLGRPLHHGVPRDVRARRRRPLRGQRVAVSRLHQLSEAQPRPAQGESPGLRRSARAHPGGRSYEASYGCELGVKNKSANRRNPANICRISTIRRTYAGFAALRWFVMPAFYISTPFWVVSVWYIGVVECW